MSHENEVAVLAQTIRTPKIVTSLRDILKPQYFQWQPFQDAWTAIETLHDNGLSIDGISLADELDRQGKLADFGLPQSDRLGRSAVSTIRDIYTKAESAETYANLVLDAYNKRRLLDFAGEMATAAANGKVSTDIINDFNVKVGQLSLPGKANHHTYPMSEASQNALNASLNAISGVKTFKSGISTLDSLLYVQNKDLVIVAARPGVGKTALLMTMLSNNLNKRGLLIELETGHEQATQRIISHVSNVPAYRILRGTFNENEKKPIMDAVNTLSESNISICDLPGMKLSQIRTVARGEYAKNPLSYILIDYLQLAHADGKNDNRAGEVAEVARGLKELAKELDLPIIAAAQLNRAMDVRAEKRPQLSDLRESGEIEQSADSVVFIHQTDEGRQLILAKQRMGSLGNVDVYFHEEMMRFTDANTQTFNMRDPYKE